jgi:DNA-binding helix-hairpin-helix protein with protein kinase domain
MRTLGRPGDEVIDSDGTTHTLAQQIGRAGGQGVVFATAGGGAAVKLRTSDVDPAELQRQLRAVSHLPVDGLPVALPRRTLRPPDVGYVMTHLTGMIPILQLRSTRARDPAGHTYGPLKDLRSRVQLLAGLANVVAVLHGRGLIYGDLSGSNVLVSESIERGRVWLIDLDNLRWESEPEPVVFTTGYVAPEVYTRRTGLTTASEAYALAVLVFETLTLVPPFAGRQFREGEWKIMKDRRDRGDLAWVDDPHGKNRAPYGVVDRALALSPRLRRLAAATFGPDRHDPLKRPTASNWAQALESAALATVSCPSCAATHYVDCTICPECDRPTTSAVVLLRALSSEGGSATSAVGAFALGEERVEVPTRVLLPHVDRLSPRRGLVLERHGAAVTVEAPDDELALRAVTAEGVCDGTSILTLGTDTREASCFLIERGPMAPLAGRLFEAARR